MQTGIGISTSWKSDYSNCKYQIERAIAKLKETPGYKHNLEIPTVWIIQTVIAELEAYLENHSKNLQNEIQTQTK